MLEKVFLSTILRLRLIAAYIFSHCYKLLSAEEVRPRKKIKSSCDYAIGLINQ